jgi:hypothetical protein
MSEDEKAKRRAREAALAVLALARRTRKELDAETRVAADQAGGAIERQRGGDGKLRKGMALAAVILVSGRLAGAYERVLTGARRGARTVGVERLAIELDALGLPEADLARGIAARAEEDGAAALIAGQSLAAAWQGAAAHEVERALRQDKSIPRALATARDVVGPRAVRTATTEVSVAFNGERVTALREALERDRLFTSAFRERKFGRRWDAQLEACKDCDAHDGEVTGIDEGFAGGDEPGAMHPHCLCVDTIVEL